jgi:hypothetical protein
VPRAPPWFVHHRDLRRRGADSSRRGRAFFAALARITVPLNGLDMPDDLKRIDDIGDEYVGMSTALRAVHRAARVVPGFRERDRILTAVTNLQIAEYQTYFLYGVATGARHAGGVAEGNTEEPLDESR